VVHDGTIFEENFVTTAEIFPETTASPPRNSEGVATLQVLIVDAFVLRTMEEIFPPSTARETAIALRLPSNGFPANFSTLLPLSRNPVEVATMEEISVSVDPMI
jgi:hypothetical protein